MNRSFIVFWQGDIESFAQCFDVVKVIFANIVSGMEFDHYIRWDAFYRIAIDCAGSGQMMGFERNTIYIFPIFIKSI